jgi:hypothetical protein
MESYKLQITQHATALLRAYSGAPVRIVRADPIAEGWSAQFGAWPWIMRCTVEDDSGVLPSSVVVKVRRPAEHWRGDTQQFHIERAALQFLTDLGVPVAARLLAADDEGGMLIMEDLGTGVALEDLLVGHDAVTAEHGLMLFARSLARMHAATIGHADTYDNLRSRWETADRTSYRVQILDDNIEWSWNTLREITAERPHLPPTHAADADVAELLHVLAEPGSFLVFTNGDMCPQNCRMVGDSFRFLDFENAAFRHALLDVTSLRFPFPACPCWSRLPTNVSQRAEAAYREAFAPTCPDVLDDAIYARGLAAACAAWTLLRMTRLPKLERSDEPHPMGFSKRGQLLDMIDTTVKASQQSGSFPALTAWLADMREALRARWPHLAPMQPLYPAFRPDR